MPPKKQTILTLHRRILKDALFLAWNKKYLWIFAFFAALIGFGGVSDILFNTYEHAGALLISNSGEAVIRMIPHIQTIQEVAYASENPLIGVTIFLTITVAILSLLGVIVSVAISALITGISTALNNVKATGEELFRSGVKNAWNVFIINIISKIIIGASIVITGVNLANLVERGGNIVDALLYLGSFILFAFVILIASLLAVFGSIAVVTEKKSLVSAIHEAIQTASKHWLPSIEMSILLLLMSVFISLGAAFILMILFIPLIFFVALFAFFNFPIALTLVLVLSAVLVILSAIFIVSFLTTFQTTAWLLLWKELRANTVTMPSKIIRLADNLHRKIAP